MKTPTETITLRANTIEEAVHGPRKIEGILVKHLFGGVYFDFILDQGTGFIYHARSGTPLTKITGDARGFDEAKAVLMGLKYKMSTVHLRNQLVAAPVINARFPF